METSNVFATILYGSKEVFEQQLENVNDYETLTEMVIDFELVRNSRSTINRSIENLVVFSDEYGSVNESVLQNFIIFVKTYDVQNIYLQNPPMKVIQNLKRFIANDHINEIYHSYDKLTLEKVKDFSIRVSDGIVGQNRAIRDLRKSLISHIKFNKDEKPLVLMFYGPSGVGKTETSKILSGVLETDSELFIKPFGMYQNVNAVNHLYGEKLSEGCFAKELLDRKSNVILLDEFDKANSICYSAFYQLFDEGIFIDKNYFVNLKNSIIICTSNYKDTDDIRKNLGDPIFYRFDAFIKFENLSKESKQRIVEGKYNKYISELDIEDAKIIESKNTKEKLLESVVTMPNVRKIDSIIKDVLSFILLEEIDSED